MSILAMYKKVFRKNIPAILFGAVLLIFNISNVYSAGFYGGEEFQVNTRTAGDQVWSPVSVLANGNIVIAWSSGGQDGSSYGVCSQIFNSSIDKIGNEFQVNNYTVGDQSHPSITALSNSRFVIVWHSADQDGSLYGIYAQIFDAFGAKIGSEFRANTHIISNQYYPSITTLNNGNFVVAWLSSGQDGSGYGIFGQIFDEVGAKVSNEFQVNTYTANDQVSLFSVAALSNGNFVAVWSSDGQDESSFGIYAQIFNEIGAKVGNEFQVNTYTVDSQVYPIISSLNNGFVVVWRSYGQDESEYGVFAQIFSESGTKVGNEFQVNTYTIDSQIPYAVTALSNGDFLVIWEGDGQDGSGKGVYGQVFNEVGARAGNEFQINIHTIGDQYHPFVASFANGNFIVTWASFGQDGDDYGVFGRIFTPNTIPTISGLTKSGTKNTALTFDKNDFTDLFTDADDHSMTKIKITSLPNNGDLKLLSSGAVSEDQEIDVDDIEDLVFDPDKDWTGATNFGWQGYDGTDYSDAGVVTIKINDESAESGEWWPEIVTGGVVATITAACSVVSGITLWLCRRQIARLRCCHRPLDEEQLGEIEQEELK